MERKQSITFHGMGTTIKIEGSCSRQANDWQTQMREWFATCEAICSRFLSNSELTRLNKAQVNSVIAIHPILYDVLHIAFEYAIRTQFRFNPFIGTVLKEMGYVHSFQKQMTVHSYEKKVHRMPSSLSLSFLPQNKAVMKHTMDEIDLGGIGKGWSVDQAYGQLKRLGMDDGLIDAGGDMFIWGESQKTIGIANPFSENEDIAHFIMSNGAVATSNVLYRSWKMNGQTAHHIIDGQTGQNPRSDVVQATAFAYSVIEAEVISKVLCMLPANEGIRWLNAYFPNAACVIVKQNKQMLMSPSIVKHVDKMVI
ncbi:FAD:protein FMN transferase [Anoxybacillus flavithermus]|uniref:FAD:protein FMN transferase n=1 Tax=Anoxybacillus flavithermus TaxID=33934 RepID=A0A2G5RQP3_9BACL|nr:MULTISPECIES: FAD:protein FMN transferase [Anoxybacillus]KFZ43047.1 thiamine biosynthesis protein ApbE [Anoxybacillus sp. KU2-6(11)]PIC05002.1 FAD:protein FMN transferase [Anoxybacillus flavithermus]